MKIKMEYNDYVLIKPYEIEPQTALIVNSNDTPCLGKVAVDYEIWGVKPYMPLVRFCI